MALDALEEVLNSKWSYRHANGGADFDGAFAAARRAANFVDDPVHFGTDLEFSMQLNRILYMYLGVDGHAFIHDKLLDARPMQFSPNEIPIRI